MTQTPKRGPNEALEPDLPEIDDSSESIFDSDEDDSYGDDFLDSFISDSDLDDELLAHDFGHRSHSSLDGDADFDRYFRNTDSDARPRGRRRNRRSRSWKGAFDFDGQDYSSSRRPRR